MLNYVNFLSLYSTWLLFKLLFSSKISVQIHAHVHYLSTNFVMYMYSLSDSFSSSENFFWTFFFYTYMYLWKDTADLHILYIVFPVLLKSRPNIGLEYWCIHQQTTEGGEQLTEPLPHTILCWIGRVWIINHQGHTTIKPVKQMYKTAMCILPLITTINRTYFVRL